jgi:hypothetical protein
MRDTVRVAIGFPSRWRHRTERLCVASCATLISRKEEKIGFGSLHLATRAGNLADRQKGRDMTVTTPSNMNGNSSDSHDTHGAARLGTKLIHVGSEASEETGAVSIQKTVTNRVD